MTATATPTEARQTPDYSNTELLRLGEMFTLASEGTIVLPPAVIAAIDSHAQLAEEEAALKAQAEPNVGKELLAELGGGAPLPSPADVALRLRSGEAKQLLLAAAKIALPEREEQLATAIRHSPVKIITDSLRPALEVLLDDARRAVDALGPYDVTDDRSLSEAPRAAVDARNELERLALTYWRLRAVQFVMNASEKYKPNYDDPNPLQMSPQSLELGRGWCSEMRDLDRFWPYGRARNTGLKPPWPHPKAARLVFLIRASAQLWIPTNEERDQAFRAAFPDSARVQGRRILPLGGE